MDLGGALNDILKEEVKAYVVQLEINLGQAQLQDASSSCGKH